MTRRAAALLAALAVGGCGGDEQRPAPDRRSASELTCAELRDTARLKRVARRLVVRVVAPDGHSEAETADLIAGSLRGTCAQPGRPDRRPVAGVLRAVQAHLDQEAAFEGG